MSVGLQPREHLLSMLVWAARSGRTRVPDQSVAALAPSARAEDRSGLVILAVLVPVAAKAAVVRLAGHGVVRAAVGGRRAGRRAGERRAVAPMARVASRPRVVAHRGTTAGQCWVVA